MGNAGQCRLAAPYSGNGGPAARRASGVAVVGSGKMGPAGPLLSAGASG